MKNFTKALLVLAVMFAVSTANAQIKVGGGAAFATGISNVGISANGEYAINESWEAAAGFTYFFKKNYLTWSSLDLDAHYIFTEVDGLGKIYGIAGLNVLFASFNVPKVDLGEFGSYGGNYTSSSAGVNLGVGTKIGMGENMTLSPEVKYVIGNGGFLMVGVKILFGI